MCETAALWLCEQSLDAQAATTAAEYNLQKSCSPPEMERTCVRACVQRKEWCAYLGVHASVYTLVILNAA